MVHMEAKGLKVKRALLACLEIKEHKDHKEVWVHLGRLGSKALLDLQDHL